MPQSSVAVRMKISFSSSRIFRVCWSGRTIREIGEHGQDEPDEDADARAEIAADAKIAARDPGGDGGRDHERAVREVEHAGHAEDQGEAGGAERIERADREAVDEDLPEEHRSGPIVARDPFRQNKRKAPELSVGGLLPWGRSVGLDEGRELQLAVGEPRGPQIDLLAVLPLQHQPGDRAFADLQCVRVRRRPFRGTGCGRSCRPNRSSPARRRACRCRSSLPDGSRRR